MSIISLIAIVSLCFVGIADDSIKERTDPLIREHRMGKLTVRTEPGASIEITQLKHDFLFGTAISSSMFTAEADEEDSEMYRSIIRTHFNAAVHENALKWKHTNATGPKSDFRNVDAVLDWCEENGIWMRGHTIFWGRPGTIPEWVKALDNDTLRQVLAQRAHEVTTRYRGRVHEYDLNNEMLRPNLFVERLGDGITRDMFLWAKEGDPEASLCLNDVNILNSTDFETPDQSIKMSATDLDRYVDQIRELLEQGVPVDGIGIQAHIFNSIPDTDIDIEQMQKALDKLAQFNLPIKITEFDMPTMADEEKRAKNLDGFYRTAFAHPAVVGIFMWGFWEGAHWMPISALWTEDWQAKPAAIAYENLVLNEWWTKWKGKADENGIAEVPVFYGKHLVEVGNKRQVVELTRQQGEKAVLIGHHGRKKPRETVTPEAFSIHTKIGDLLENEDAKAILAKYFGEEAINSPQMALSKGFTLKQISSYRPDLLNEEQLQSIDKELRQLEH